MGRANFRPIGVVKLSNNISSKERDAQSSPGVFEVMECMLCKRTGLRGRSLDRTSPMGFLRPPEGGQVLIMQSS